MEAGAPAGGLDHQGTEPGWHGYADRTERGVDRIHPDHRDRARPGRDAPGRPATRKRHQSQARPRSRHRLVSLAHLRLRKAAPQGLALPQLGSRADADLPRDNRAAADAGAASVAARALALPTPIHSGTFPAFVLRFSPNGPKTKNEHVLR